MTTTPDFRALLADDAYAASFQSLGQYRTALLKALATPPPEPPTAIGPEWQPCVKLPITVHVREQRPGETHSSTREGITPLRPDDLIMRGVQGEEYPIGRELFNQTYGMGEALATSPPVPSEPLTNMEIAAWADADSYVPNEEMDPEIYGYRRCFTEEEFGRTIRAALKRWGHR